MSEARMLKCPGCGASLDISGDATTVKCPYCGQVSVVPPELRKAQAPAIILPPWPLPTASPTPTERKSSGNPFLGILIVVVGLVICGGIALGADQVNSFINPTPTIAHVNRTLEGTLPREVQYANLQFRVTGATISNQVPNSSSKPRYSADQAYAVINITVTNPTNEVIQSPLGLAKLQTGDGKTYSDDGYWAENIEPQSTKEGQWQFNVPLSQTWQGAKIILAELGKEQAVIPLDGAAITSPYPQKLNVTEQVKVQDVSYKLTGAVIDLDAEGTRADAGNRFLILSVQVLNQGKYPVAISGSNFRLIVGGTPIAPVSSLIEAIDGNSTKNGDVVF